MFEDVWYACRIWRVRLESDAEDIVLVFACYMEIVGARLVMLEEQGRELKLRHVLALFQSEAMNAIARLGQRVEH